MKPERILRKFISTVTVILAAWWVAVYLSVKFSLGSWFFILVGALSAAFLAEAIKSIDGQQVFWGTLSANDRFIVFIDLTLILLFGLLPLKMDMSLGFTLIFVALGYGVAWFFTKVFGSDELRKKIFW